MDCCQILHKAPESLSSYARGLNNGLDSIDSIKIDEKGEMTDKIFDLFSRLSEFCQCTCVFFKEVCSSSSIPFCLFSSPSPSSSGVGGERRKSTWWKIRGRFFLLDGLGPRSIGMKNCFVNWQLLLPWGDFFGRPTLGDDEMGSLLKGSAKKGSTKLAPIKLRLLD